MAYGGENVLARPISLKNVVWLLLDQRG